jgi:cytochrome oxidase Cu insertion factor (SCO1/SenC/PrrC family)
VKWALALGVLTMLLLGAMATALGLTRQEDEVVTGFGRAKKYRGSEPPSGFRLPDFALRDYAGDKVRSGDLRGRVVLITFLDSQCTEACPIIAAQIARTMEGLSTSNRRAVEPIAISTDPREDTAESVRRFLRRQHAVGKLRYLTGPESAIRSVWKSFKILSSLESGEDTLHSAPVRIYNRRGFWVSTLHAGVDLTPSNLSHDIGVAFDDEDGKTP